MTIYGKRLAEAMGKNDLTVPQLAKKAGLSKYTIYGALERDALPSAYTLGVLADVLDVSMDWLWGRK